VGPGVRGEGRLPVAGPVDRRGALPPQHGGPRDGAVRPVPAGRTDRQPGMPIKIGGVAEAPRRAPLLGEHDDEVLAGLGYTERAGRRLAGFGCDPEAMSGAQECRYPRGRRTAMSQAAKSYRALYIDGKWVDGKETLAVIDKYTGDDRSGARGVEEMTDVRSARPTRRSRRTPPPGAQAVPDPREGGAAPGPAQGGNRDDHLPRGGEGVEYSWARCSGRSRRSSSPPRRRNGSTGSDPDGRQHRRGGADGFWLRARSGRRGHTPFNFPEPRGTQGGARRWRWGTRCAETRSTTPLTAVPARGILERPASARRLSTSSSVPAARW